MYSYLQPPTMTNRNNSGLLLLFFTIVIFPASFTSATTIEFARSLSSSILSSYRPTSSAYTSYASLWARSPTRTGWYRVCSTASLNAETARSICLQMGFSSSGADFSSSTSSGSARFGFTGLSCSASSSTVTGDSSTNFSQCTFSSSYSACSGNSVAHLRCGNFLNDGGTHGIFADSISDATATDVYYLRQRSNGQIQTRALYTTNWKNMYASTNSFMNFNNANALCFWTRGIKSTSTPPLFLFMDLTSKRVNPSDRTILDSANGAGIGDLKCTKSSSNLGDCSYSSPNDGTDYTARAISVECQGSTSNGRSMGNDWAIRLTTSTNYRRIVEIGKYPFSGNNAFRSSCTSFHGTISATTAKSLCQLAGYGDDAVAYPASTSSSSLAFAAARYTGVSCEAGATSWQNDCTHSTQSQSYCNSAHYLTLRCEPPSSSTPSPPNNNNNNNNDDDSSGSVPTSIIAGASVGGVVFLVIVGCFAFSLYKNQQVEMTATGGGTNQDEFQMSSTFKNNNNNSWNTNNTNTQQHMITVGQPMMGGNNHNNTGGGGWNAPASFSSSSSPPPPPPPPQNYPPQNYPPQNYPQQQENWGEGAPALPGFASHHQSPGYQ